jgi:ATP-dependent Lon protease
VRRQIEGHGFSPSASSSRTRLRRIINDYTAEAGSAISTARSQRVPQDRAQGREGDNGKGRHRPRQGREFLGPARFFREIAERTDRSGVAIGLAWTRSGGEILFVESTACAGAAKVTITGGSGDCHARVRARRAVVDPLQRDALRIDDELFDTSDFHIHVPAARHRRTARRRACTLDACRWYRC